MNVGKVMLPMGGAVVGAGVAEMFRKPGRAGFDATLVLGVVGGLVLGIGAAVLLPDVTITQGKRYHVVSPMPTDTADKAVVLAGLAQLGAIVTTLGPTTLEYDLTAGSTRGIHLHSDAFDFAEPVTGRDVKLVIDGVTEIAS